MSGQLSYAHRAMLAIATYLVTCRVEDADRDLMRSSLARVLPDCETGPSSIKTVRQFARQLVEAETHQDRSDAEIRLEQALHNFSRAGAAAYIDAWERQRKGRAS